MLMLIDTADPRYHGGDDGPDEERERRWEPIGRRLFVPAAGSVSCLIVSAVTGPLVSAVLVLASIVLLVRFVRVAMADAPPAGRLGSTGEDADQPRA